MKITKEQLKKIIKEELGTILKEMGPEFPGEELPQGSELEQALNPAMAQSDRPPTAKEEMEDWIRNNPEVKDWEVIMAQWAEISSGHSLGRM